MNVLVTTSSRYGATREMGDRIAATLDRLGHEVVVMEPAAVDDFDRFDAVIVGGAVYAGRWARDGREFLERHGNQLAAKPVWVFSSGPVGDPPHPPGPPVGMTDLLGTLIPRDHAVFAGKIDRSGLRLGDRAIAMALKAPDGDFRDWTAIDAWAERVHVSLSTPDDSRPAGAT